MVAYHAEHPTNPEFATLGDALWWGVVSLTTVGYGDIVPKTGPERWAGVTIMITGVAVLGLLAGSLASFFRLDGPQGDDGSANGESTEAADNSQQGRAPDGPFLRRRGTRIPSIDGTDGRRHPGTSVGAGRRSRRTQLPMTLRRDSFRVRPRPVLAWMR